MITPPLSSRAPSRWPLLALGALWLATSAACVAEAPLTCEENAEGCAQNAFADLGQSTPAESPDMSQASSQDMGSWGAGADQGEWMHNNATLDMAPASVAPRLELGSAELRFAHASRGEVQRRDVLLRSTSAERVSVAQWRWRDAQGVEIERPEAISITLVDRGGSERELHAPLELAAGDEVVLRLRVEEQAHHLPRTVELELQGSTSEGLLPPLYLPLVYELDGPCLEVELPTDRYAAPDDEHVLALGELDALEASIHRFRMRNCGDRYPVRVQDLYVARDPYDLLELELPERPSESGALFEVAIDGEVELELLALLPQGLAMGRTTPVAELVMRSDAAGREVVDVALTAQPESGGACPRAEAEARLVDDPARALSNALHTEPLRTVWLTGERSSSNGGPPLERYEWALVERPEGSHARLNAASGGQAMSASRDPARSLFLDLPGRYVAELRVYTLNGQEGCHSDRLEIVATPSQALYISTLWETPADPNLSDGIGADLDLHYLHPLGSFDQAPHDIFWRNRTADWGLPGPLDDPFLLRDDMGGPGPEVIAHAQPEPGATYRVGVHAYDLAGLGTSYVTTLFHVNGQLVAQSRAQPLSRTNDYLAVAEITWSLTTPTITLLEELEAAPR